MDKLKYFFCAMLITFLSSSASHAQITSEYLQYADQRVKLDIYNPGSSSCPVAILIHGAAGIEGDRAERYRNFATDLRKKGIIASW